MTKKKPYYKSVTLWFNVIILSLALLDKEYLKAFGMEDKTIELVTLTSIKLTALFNIIIRVVFTKDKIGGTKNESE